MAMMDQDFWRRMEGAAPGLFDLGVGLYGRNQGNKEAASRLREARGPLYDQAMTGASRTLQSASMDPRAAAAERFNAQRGLLEGVDAKSETDLIRMLRSKGMLDVANFNPGVEGIAPSNVAMNPHMAAYYAARNARDSKMAADSLDAGERTLDSRVNRAGMLQQQAANQQATGLSAARTQPSRSAQNANLLRGGVQILKDTGLMKDIGGMIRGGLGSLFSGGFDTPWLDTSANSWGMDWYG